MYEHSKYKNFIIYKMQTECDCVPTCVVSILNSLGEDYDLKKAINLATEKGYLYFPEFFESDFDKLYNPEGVKCGMDPGKIPFFVKDLTDGKYKARLKTDEIGSLRYDPEERTRLVSENMLEIISRYYIEILSKEEMPLIVGLEGESLDHSVVLFEINNNVVYGDPKDGLVIKMNKKDFRKDFNSLSIKIEKSEKPD